MVRTCGRIFLPIFIMSLLGGCCAEQCAVENPSGSATPHGPSSLTGDLTITLDMPYEWAQSLKVPNHLRGELHVSGHADAIKGAPQRSRYSTTIDLRITDPQGKAVYLAGHSTISGEGDGTPNRALWGSFQRIGTMLGALGRELPATQPSTRPTTEPTIHVNGKARLDL